MLHATPEALASTAALLMIVRYWKQPRWHLNRRMDKENMWHINKKEYYSDDERNEITKFVVNWMTLEKNHSE